jgi:hydroxymethylpyrimidine pyrophosphatase-like HAD family hydrolase
MTAAAFRPRAVALDVDGTVLSRTGVLPAAVAAAVRRVVAAGVPVVMATGRAWRSTRPLVEELGLPDGYAVTSNGAVTMAYETAMPARDRVVESVTFDPAPVAKAVLARRPNVALAVDHLHGYYVNRPFPDGDLSGAITICPLEQMMVEPVTRLIIRDPEGSEEEFEELANSLGYEGVEYYVGYTAWLDIAAEGVSKAAGLAGVAKRLDIPAQDFLALGDGRNDDEMLRWAGRGVALGDAPPQTQASADAVTGLFDDGGTVTELDRWFGEPAPDCTGRRRRIAP